MRLGVGVDMGRSMGMNMEIRMGMGTGTRFNRLKWGASGRGGDATIKPCYQTLCVMSKGISVYVNGHQKGARSRLNDGH